MRNDGTDKLWRHIQRIKGIDRALKTPVDFFGLHKERYLAIARQVTEGVLSLARPADIEPADWLFRIASLVSAIGAELVNAEEVGMMIYLDARQFAQLKFEDIARGTFAKDTVLNWVRAGRKEDPLGKDFDERDLGDSDETIAARVWWALYTGRSKHSAEQIRAYLQGTTQKAVMELLPAVLAAWVETLAVAVRKDWKAWAQSAIRAA